MLASYCMQMYTYLITCHCLLWIFTMLLFAIFRGGVTELGDITVHNIKQLKRLNQVVFPVVYNDKFYKDVLDVGELAKLGGYITLLEDVVRPVGVWFRWGVRGKHASLPVENMPLSPPSLHILSPSSHHNLNPFIITHPFLSPPLSSFLF